MNYLAHAYLSFGISEIAVGNLISDFVKGKKKLEYPDAIQKGISLHRAIDTFTDSHPVTQQAKVFFKPVYRLYAGALTDVVYDHFLAKDAHEFPGEEGRGLLAFAEKTYEQLAPFQALFPEKFARMFPYMRSQNWLYHYRYKEGIYNSFTGLSRRAAYMPPPEQACELFEEHYTALEACYKLFFPALKDFAFATLQQLIENPPSGEN